jgi:hypothetical protein
MMVKNEMRRACIMVVALALFTPCVSASEQSAARALELNERNYEQIRKALAGPKDESGWRKISWRPSFGEAVVEARKQEKPILLWVMNGHPCGMT